MQLEERGMAWVIDTHAPASAAVVDKVAADMCSCLTDLEFQRQRQVHILYIYINIYICIHIHTYIEREMYINLCVGGGLYV